MIDRLNIDSDALNFFREALRQRLGPNLLRMLLFGSRARGDADEQSDYDLLIIVKSVGETVDRAIDETAGQALLDYGAVFSAFPVAERTLQRRKFSPFLVNAQNEAILL
ncbi:MAG: nucleotidyltransferase domain-containing protein [bacterium]